MLSLPTILILLTAVFSVLAVFFQWFRRARPSTAYLSALAAFIVAGLFVWRQALDPVENWYYGFYVLFWMAIAASGIWTAGLRSLALAHQEHFDSLVRIQDRLSRRWPAS